MPTLPAVIVTLLLPFERLFDPRTWRKAQLLAMGAILSPGKRTVSSALNILGIGQHGDFAIYHHVLNRARWSPLQLSRALLLLVAGRLGSSTEPWCSALSSARRLTLRVQSRPGTIARPAIHTWTAPLPGAVAAGGRAPWFIHRARWNDAGAGRLRPRGGIGIRCGPRTTRW